MIIFEIFLALFVITMLFFGKIEFSSKSLKLSINIAGRNFPLISIIKKKDDSGNDNVSI